MTLLRRRLLLALGATMFSLMLGEIVARIALPLMPDPAGTGWLGDEHCGYRLRPVEPGEVPEDHDSHINTLGFRDRNHALQPEPGVQRVIGLGDSFIYGVVPIAQNFMKVAEDELNAAGLPTETVLAGVPGWHGGNQAGWLEHTGLELQPDLVILNYFVGNDVTGLAVGGRVIRGTLYPTTSPQRLRHFLRKSVLFLMVETQLWLPLRHRVDPPEERIPPPDEAPIDDLYLYIASQYIPVFEREPDGRTAELWEESLGHLDRIDAMCREAGVTWLLVLIPDEMQVDPVIQDQVLDRLELDPAGYDFDAPQERLKACAGELGVPVLDLLPLLRDAHTLEGRQYVPNDTHWNIKGNAVAGRAIAQAAAPLLR